MQGADRCLPFRLLLFEERDMGARFCSLCIFLWLILNHNFVSNVGFEVCHSLRHDSFLLRVDDAERQYHAGQQDAHQHHTVEAMKRFLPQEQAIERIQQRKADSPFQNIDK